MPPQFIDRIDQALDDLLPRLGHEIRLGLPLGIGKPNPFVNRLYQRAKADPQLKLDIFTALSLERPRAHSELEARFLTPFVDRVYGDYPDLDYLADLRAGRLPPNITVSEFFLKSGDWLRQPYAQQHYISSNYTHIARDMVALGANVVAQAVALRETPTGIRLSLSCNPDMTQDMRALLQARRDRGEAIFFIAVINHELPFMPNEAEVDPALFDYVITDPAGTHTLFSAPNMAISMQDYLIGLYTSTLVEDGGTLQIGIGSLGDAIAQSLILRDRNNIAYRTIIAGLNPIQSNTLTPALAPLQEGLYGCSEMFVNGFLKLIEAGIIRRQVYPDAVLQELLNAKRIRPEPSLAMLDELLAAGHLDHQLNSCQINWLKRTGILRDHVTLAADELVIGDQRVANDLHAATTRTALADSGLGSCLHGGIYMHGGFFLGPRDFYQALRTMAPEQLAGIGMSRISFINHLYGDEALKRAQRYKGRFINTCMMTTLTGAAVSDALEDGRVVSGVGGQYNFVAMSHELADARSILMMRAWRTSEGRATSNIVPHYGHVTIPRHLRDVVVTEYGVADLRGQNDSEVVKRLLAITDSRFQDELLASAQRSGKIAADFTIPDAWRRNRPELWEPRFREWQQKGWLPAFPFGTDLTEDELRIAKVLQKMKAQAEHPVTLVGSIVKGLASSKAVPEQLLARLKLSAPRSLQERVWRTLFIENY